MNGKDIFPSPFFREETFKIRRKLWTALFISIETLLSNLVDSFSEKALICLKDVAHFLIESCVLLFAVERAFSAIEVVHR